MATASSGWITLNVGGKIFATTRQTLTLFKDSVLARMFADPPLHHSLVAAQQDTNGAYLIDRDPNYFAPILNFLRHGKLILDPSISPEGVYEEAKFFQIEPLIEVLHPRNRPDFNRTQLILHRASIKTFENLRLTGVDFSGLDLHEEEFNCSLLHSAIFDNATLSHASFYKASADYASFRNTNLDTAVFLEASLTGARFDGAILTYGNFRRAKLDGTTFRGTNCSGALFQKANLQGATFTDGAILQHCKFQNANLRGVDFRGAVLDQVHFSGADMRNCQIDWKKAERLYIGRVVVTREQYDAMPFSNEYKESERIRIMEPNIELATEGDGAEESV